MIQTDILIIGAGPCGLFTVFEAGLLKLKCHLVDVLPWPGGQLSEVYPKKPIYDIPGHPSILASDLVDKLMEQIAPFKPGFTLGERAEAIEKIGEKMYELTTNHGTQIQAPVIVLAGGIGSFEPRKPLIDNIEMYEDRGIYYMVKDPEVFRNKRILIAGGGDSALDWTIELADIVSKVTLIHRRKSFKGAIESIEKVKALAEEGKVDLITDARAVGLRGEGRLSGVVIKHKSTGEHIIEVDAFLPLFGLTPKLGPIAEWGLNMHRSAIEVDTVNYSTSAEGIYAIGDMSTYEGKLKLILCGFHEATLMIQSAFKYIYPEEKARFRYTSVTGVQGM